MHLIYQIKKEDSCSTGVFAWAMAKAKELNKSVLEIPTVEKAFLSLMKASQSTYYLLECVKVCRGQSSTVIRRKSC